MWWEVALLSLRLLELAGGFGLPADGDRAALAHAGTRGGHPLLLHPVIRLVHLRASAVWGVSRKGSAPPTQRGQKV